MNNEINIRHLIYFIIACLLVFLPGLAVDVMNIDAAQYASMSREMLASKNWLQLYCHGNDYLDKPPLLFWLSALSFKFFGIYNWSYKLPSFLFAILGIFSTAKLGELLYNKKTGILAAVMLTFSFGMFVMTNDIRTDTILLGSTIFATWQIMLYLKTKRFIYLILGFSGIAVAMLAKGPLGFMLPLAALSSDFIYKRQWKNFFRWQWIVGLFIVALFLFPMCYGLYEQFDAHPEKVLDGKDHISGLRFYFWTQSFGRITGESDWGTKLNNGAGPFFFTHTILWVFFPWCIFLVPALVKNCIILIKSKFKTGHLPEMLSTGGFILVFIALSVAKYKLPHYVYVLLPLGAIISSRFLLHDVLNPDKKYLLKIFSVFHWIFLVSIIVVCSFLLFIVFPGASVLTITASYSLLATAIVFALKLKDTFMKLMYPLLAGLLAFYFVGDAHFYPRLLKYQSSDTIGRILVEKKVPDKNFYAFEISDHALDFYSGKMPSMLFPGDSVRIRNLVKENGNLFLFTDADGESQLKNGKYHIVSEQKFDDFHVQFLSMNFLFPETRTASLRYKFLVELSN